MTHSGRLVFISGIVAGAVLASATLPAQEAAKDSRNISALAASARDPDGLVRLGAIRSLGATGDALAIAPLKAALKDDAQENRKAAARALGSIPDGRAVAALLGELGERATAARADVMALVDKDLALEGAEGAANRERMKSIKPEELDFFMLMAAAGEPGVEEVTEVLGAVTAPYAVGVYLSGLDDAQQVVRLFSVNMLVQMKEKSAVEPLIARLPDADPLMRAAAAAALGEFGDKRAVPPLLKTLDDPSARVQERAMESLETLTGRKFGTLEEWKGWKGE